MPCYHAGMFAFGQGSNMEKPLKDMTVADLVNGSEAQCTVIFGLVEALRTMRESMPQCAEHLLRRIFVSSDETIKYDPGDEPPVEMELVAK